MIEVNGEEISLAEVRAETSRLRLQAEANGAVLEPEERVQLRDRAIESLVDRKLLFQEARLRQLIPTEKEILEICARLSPRMDGVAGCRAGTDLDEMTRDVERQLVLERIIDYWCRDLKPPRRTEVRDYYTANKEYFRTPELVRAAHIVRYVEARDPEAERNNVAALRQRIIDGENFAELAAAHSDCPENGGNLGYFPRGVMIEEFDEVVFAAPVSSLTDVFESRFGFHIALVLDHKPEGGRTLEEVAPNIEERLLRQKQDREVGRQLDLLRSKAAVRRTA